MASKLQFSRLWVPKTVLADRLRVLGINHRPDRPEPTARTVNGAAGAVLTHQGRPVALLGFTVTAGRITAIDAITDPDRLTLPRLGQYSGSADTADADAQTA